MNRESRKCQNCHQEFWIEPDDFGFYKKRGVPAPTFCPECRYIRRLLDRNEYNFYKRKCDATGENIISIYKSDVPFPVYKQEYWKSDAWDGLSYGREFDFSKPFFEQYEDLRNAVPHLALVNSNSENSEYTNQAQDNKDCYMLVTSNTSEKCMYGSWCQNTCFFLSDCYMAEGSEFCYECMNITKCSNCRWCRDCQECVNVNFAVNCRGCTDCFGCVGLRNKSHYWFNEKLSKEEYEKRYKEFKCDWKSIREVQEKLSELNEKFPVKYYHGVKAFNSTGDYLENTERAREVFNCRDNKDTAYMQDAWNRTENCLDCTEIINGQFSYEVQGIDTPHGSIAVRSCFGNIVDSCYCDMCFSCSDCFGCFGLKQKQYCILNKQYSKEEYLELKKRIIAHMEKTGEWGEYFPAEVSPFAYNESMAQDYFPLEKEEAIRKGYSWYDRPVGEYKITMTSETLPETISETKNDIVKEVIRCRTQEDEAEKRKNPLCTIAFRVIPLELVLYQKIGIPVPQYCFPCRRSKRFELRNPRRLYNRKCQCAGTKSENGRYSNMTGHFHEGGRCPNEFKTSYDPNRKEIVYCETCYNAEVV